MDSSLSARGKSFPDDLLAELSAAAIAHCAGGRSARYSAFDEFGEKFILEEPSPDEPAQSGQGNQPALDEHHSRLGVEAGLVLCSSAVRARQTLDLLKPSLGGAPVQIEEALYAAPAAALLERLQTLTESLSSVLLIGHNPGMKELALPPEAHRRVHCALPQPRRGATCVPAPHS